MGFEDIFGEGNQWMLIIPLIIIMYALFFRRRRAEGTQMEIASSLFFDISENLRIVEGFGFQKRPKKFRTGSWQRNSEKVGFLETSLQSDLDEAFGLAESFNQEVDAAKKQKSNIYLSGVDVHKIEGPLTRSKEGLQQWIKTNMQQAGPDAGRRGCMGGGLGG
jgi:hypothetical protein